MNINTIVKRIKRKIGIYGIALPVEDLDGLILDILEDTTLPVFSLYVPMEEIMTLDMDSLHNPSDLGDQCDLYILPEFPGRKLLYVKHVEYDESLMRGAYYPSRSIFSTSTAVADLLQTNLEKQIIDLTTEAVTFHYVHPRKLYIFDSLISSRLRITMAFEHDKSFASIPPTAEESFFKLAALDIKAGLYPTIKHYDGIETSYGRIELKLDDWANAESDRDSLLEKWDDEYMLDQVDYEWK